MKAYVCWVRYFVRWHGRGGQIQHPRNMGAAEVEAFLTMLASERQVSPAIWISKGRQSAYGLSQGNLMHSMPSFANQMRTNSC